MRKEEIREEKKEKEAKVNHGELMKKKIKKKLKKKLSGVNQGINYERKNWVLRTEKSKLVVGRYEEEKHESEDKLKYLCVFVCLSVYRSVYRSVSLSIDTYI